MKPDFQIKLGDFIFSRYEIPESIRFGGDQTLAVHRLVGGRRVIDALGPDPLPLDFSGMLIGEGALSRARYLDTLRKQGRPLVFTFSELSYTVLIKSFVADFQRLYRMPYSISLEPVKDNSSPVKTIAVNSLDDQMGGDLASVVEISSEIGDATLTKKVGALQAAMASVNNFAKATQSALNTVLSPINDVRQFTKDLLAQSNNIISNVTTVGGLVPNNPVAKQAATLLDQVNAANSIPQLVQLDGVLGRMQTNLDNTNSGPKTVTVAGGNLFDIAAEQYGDATAWTTIARANGLTDPTITGTVTLTIPPTPDSNGGVLNG